MKHLEYKGTSEMPVMDVDATSRCVKVAFSCIGNVDLDSDIIEPGSFDKTWSERGPAGKNLIWHVVDHSTSVKSILGKPKELGYMGNYAFGITPMVKTDLGNDVLKMYQDGLMNQHSFAYTVPKGRSEMKGDVRHIKEVMQYEYTTVLWGANPETPMLDLVKSLGFEKAKETLNGRLERLLKGYRHGTYTDETFSLLELEIKQIQQQISDISTHAAEQAPAPDELKELLNEINNFNSHQIFIK